MPINKTTLPGTEVPVTAILDGVGGFAPYTYDISWLVQPYPNITFAVSNNNEVRISVGANVPLAVYNGTLRGVVTDAAGRERVSDLSVTLTVGNEPIAFMVSGTTWDYDQPQTFLIEFDELGNPTYTASGPLEADGYELIPLGWSDDSDPGLSIHYSSDLNRWSITGLSVDPFPDPPTGSYFGYSDDGASWNLTSILSDELYDFTHYTSVQNPENNQEIIYIPASVAYTSFSYQSGRAPLYRSTDAGATLTHVGVLKDAVQSAAYPAAVWVDDKLVLMPQAYDFSFGRFSPSRGWVRTLAVDENNLRNSWIPTVTQFNFGVSGENAQAMGYGGSVAHNGLGELMVIDYSFDALNIGNQILSYSQDNGVTWSSLGDKGLTKGEYNKIKYFGSTVILLRSWFGSIAISTDNGGTWTEYDVYNDAPWTTAFTFEGDLYNLTPFDVAYDSVNDRFVFSCAAWSQVALAGPDMGAVLFVDDLTDIGAGTVLWIPEVVLLASIASNRPNTKTATTFTPGTNYANDILRVNFDGGVFTDNSPLAATWTAEGTAPPTVISGFDAQLNTSVSNGDYAGRIYGRNFNTDWFIQDTVSDGDITAIRYYGATYVATAEFAIHRSVDEFGESWGIPYTAAQRLKDLDILNGRWVAVGENGYMIRSTNSSATTWAPVTSSFGATNINGIGGARIQHSGSQLTIRAVGDAGKIAHSNDGGTWTQMTSPFGASNVYDIENNVTDVWIAVAADGKIARTKDFVSSSAEWTLVADSSFGTSTIYGVTGDKTHTWVAVGEDGKIGRSIDNGKTWAQVTSPFGTSTIRRVRTDMVGMYIAVGDDGKVARSDDHGETWYLIDVSDVFNNTQTIRDAWASVDFWYSIPQRDVTFAEVPTNQILLVGDGPNLAGSRTAIDHVAVRPLESYWASPVSTDYHFAENESFTIQFWCATYILAAKHFTHPENPDNDEQNEVIIGAGSTTTPLNAGWWGIVYGDDLYFDAYAPVQFEVFNGVTYDALIPTGNVTTEEWVHVAVVRDGGNSITIYYNGVATASSTNVTFQRALDAYDQIFIGGAAFDGASQFDPVRFTANWNGALKDIRITKGVALYTGNFTPPGKMVE